MKNFLFLALIVSLVGSCSDKHPKKYKHYHARKKTVSRLQPYMIAANDDRSVSEKVKFTYRIRPSESMASGVQSKKPPVKFHSVRSQNQAKISSKSINSDLDDIVMGERYVGQYKVGNPYQIEDIVYYPQEYDYYEEVGVASWYGDDFHGRSTANGEIYNMGAMTAAHQTLPLPSMVRVTNLSNGKNVVVRVNDRGPFAKSRIIDVSESAADKLGFKGRGTATVKVELLEKETTDLHKSLNIKR